MAKSLKEIKEEIVKAVSKKEVREVKEKEARKVQEESAYDPSIPENKQRWLR